MIGKISRAIIVDALNAANPEFKWCFNIACSLSRGQINEDIGEDVLSFQMRLFHAIEKLEEVYRRIKLEEKRLIQKKDNLNSEWFPKRMAKLASYREVVMEVLSLGRTIGDGYAWFFYQHERELIEQHLTHHKQKLLPPEIGRLGERLTLERMQGIGENLLLYHGITSFLRMGDISLIDLKTLRVSSIGELKTHSVDKNKVSILTTFLAKEKNDFLKTLEEKISKGPPKQKDEKKLPAAMQNRLERQVKTIRSAFDNIDKEPIEKINAVRHEFYFDALSDVVGRSHSKSFEFVKAGDGFLIGALRFPKSKTWGDALLRTKIGNIDRLLPQGHEWAKVILHKNSKYNALFVGEIGHGEHLSLSAGEMPFLVWPLCKTILKDIVFQNVMIITIFNPAHLIEQLRKRGFDVTMGERGKIDTVKRTDGKSEIKLANVEYFLNLIQKSLMTEAAVISLIDQASDLAIQRKADEGGGSINMKIRPLIS